MAEQHPDSVQMSVAESEIRKQIGHEIRMELEFCLTEGYKSDPNLLKIYEESQTVYTYLSSILTIFSTYFPRKLSLTMIDLRNSTLIRNNC